MLAIDKTAVVVRAALILTTSYVAGAIIGGAAGAKPQLNQYNQVVLFIQYTHGSLTTAEMKVEFAPYNGTVASPPTFYQETDETASVASNVDTVAVNQKIHQFTIDSNYRLLFPITGEEQMKVSVKGTGTVTSSSMAIDALLVKNYS